MATIERRGDRYRARIRRAGRRERSRYFATEAEARAWAEQEEARMLTAPWAPDPDTPARTTLGEALERYLETVTPMKCHSGHRQERNRIRQLQRMPISDVVMTHLHPDYLQAWVNERLQRVSPSTVRKEIALISHLYNIARRRWLWEVRNPVEHIEQPAKSAHHEHRRLTPAEEARLLDEAWHYHDQMGLFVTIAMYTGLRRRAVHSLRWEWFDLERGVLSLPARLDAYVYGRAKRHGRCFPLAPQVIDALQRFGIRSSGPLFHWVIDTFTNNFRKIVRRAGLEGLRMHDLRHEATSRFLAAGLSAPEVATLTGHRDLNTLARYAHPLPEELAGKLGWGPARASA